MSSAPRDESDNPPSVFISHSTINSGLADALNQLLHGVLPELIVYSSGTHEISASVSPGSDFLEWMREKARTSSHVFILLTPESLRLPWLTFEAGVMTASGGESRIVPIVFELQLSEVPVPFATFQMARGDSDEDIMRLVTDLLSHLRRGPARLEVIRLSGLVREYIEQVRKHLKDTRSAASDATRHEPTPRTEVAAINDEDARMVCELLFRIVARLRERPEMLQSLDAPAFWAAVRKIRPQASTLEDLRAINADLASEPAPGPLWAAWMRHVRATELAAVVRNPEVTRNLA